MIRRRLGAGGMGEVYLAEHRNIERTAAIKFLLPEYSSKQEVVARFFAEARAASRIKHPGIVEIIDCDVHSSGRAYIVMEFLDGEDLGECLNRMGSLAIDSATSITAQIAAALEAAHDKGIVHRDLKPDNVFLAKGASEGQAVVKVLDFGIAKLVADGAMVSMKTKTGNLLGTPRYMSPEQCKGAGNVDLRTDVYALGCIAFEMLAGRAPFVKEGTGEMLVAHLMEIPPRLSSLVPSMPPELDALVARMLEKEPHNRPQTMAEVVFELESIAGATPALFPSLQGGLPSRAGGRPREASLTPAPGGSTAPGAEPPPSAIAGGTMLLPQPRSKKTTLSQAASQVATGVDLDVDVTSLRPRRRGLVALLVLLLLGGAGAAAYQLGGAQALQAMLGSKPPPPPPAPKPAPPPVAATPPPVERPTTPPPAPLPVEQVRIRVSSKPAPAQVYLDGESAPLGQTPLRIELPRDGKRTVVVLKADGFEDRTVALDPAGPPSMVVELEKLQKVSDKPRPPRSPHKSGNTKDGSTFRPMGDSMFRPMGD